MNEAERPDAYQSCGKAEPTVEAVIEAIPQRIGPYRIERILGLGGIGMVYLAHDYQLQRHVALKLLLSDRAEDRKLRQRFLTEAQSASVLKHPNLCVIYDLGDSSEYSQGNALKGRIIVGAGMSTAV